MDERIEAVEETLETLRTTLLRFLIVFGLLTLLNSVTLVILVYAFSHGLLTLKVKSLQVVQEGRIAVEIGSDEHGGYIAVADTAEKPVVLINAGQFGGCVDISGKDGESSVHLTIHEAGCGIGIFNRFGKLVASLNTTLDNAGAVGVCDANGNLVWTVTGKRW